MDQNKIIDDFGGTSFVARMFEITNGAVSQWRKNGIPKQCLRYMREKRPDLFPDLCPKPSDDCGRRVIEDRPSVDHAKKAA